MSETERIILEGDSGGEHLVARTDGEAVLIEAMVYDARMHRLRPAHLVTLTPEAGRRLRELLTLEEP